MDSQPPPLVAGDAQRKDLAEDELHLKADPAKVRFAGEEFYIRALHEAGLEFDLEDDSAHREASFIRRRLLAQHLKLSEGMAPEVFDYAKQASEALQLTDPVEIFQTAGQSNAFASYAQGVVFIGLEGELFSQLDEASFVALFGHEFGHYLAHVAVEGSEFGKNAILHSTGIMRNDSLPDKLRMLGSQLSMAKEFTSDRYGALACGSLEGALSLLMSVTTGLPAKRLRSEVSAYVEQARALFEVDLSTEDSPTAKQTLLQGSHPEHLLRAYALDLFSRTQEFAQLTGTPPSAALLSLEEVDERLLNILKLSDETERGEAKDELQGVFHEFALCCSILIIAADKEFDPEEVAILEDVFADVVPSYRELLGDAREVLERFTQLLPLAQEGGEEFASRLFVLLFHVMVADCSIQPQELEMLHRIGRTLKQERLFDLLFQGALKKIEFDVEQERAQRTLEPLAPDVQEKNAALEALLGSFQRRGGGEISLARLLKLCGASQWSSELRQDLIKRAKNHQLLLEQDPALTQEPPTDSDQDFKPLSPSPPRLVFTLNEQERQARAESASQQGPLADVRDQDSLKAALKILRERLVSGDGRSPSVRLYRLAKSRHVDLAAVDRIIHGRAERILAQVAQANSLRLLTGNEAGSQKIAQDYARSLVHLEREYRSRKEETGAEDFFLGAPFLLGRVGRFFMRAPLILHPFSLQSDGHGSSAFSLLRREGEEAIANQALLRLLFAKREFPFTDELAIKLDEAATEGPEALVELLNECGIQIRSEQGDLRAFEPITAAAADLLEDGFQIDPCAVLGFFPQSSSDLIHDYDELLEVVDSSQQDALATELNSALALLPSSLQTKLAPEPEADSPDRPIIYSDPSQRAAVKSSRQHRMLLLDGPPGTGKSQTIVNLIADALERQARVAIICEKRVALDVVKQRLDSAGLGHLSALVHDVHADRRPLCEKIAQRLENAGELVESAEVIAPPAQLSQIEPLRTEIAQLEELLSKRQQLLALEACPGFSYAALHLILSDHDQEILSEPSWQALDSQALEAVCEALDQLQPFADLFAPDSLLTRKSERGPRSLLAQVDFQELEELAQKLRQLTQTRKHYEQCYHKQALDPRALENAAEMLTHLQEQQLDAHLLGQLLQLTTAAPSSAQLSSEQPTSQEFESALVALDKHAELMRKQPNRVEFAQEFDEAPLRSQIAELRAMAGSWLRVLKPRWHQAQKQLRSQLKLLSPEHASEKIDATFLEQLDLRTRQASCWAAARKLYRALGKESLLPNQGGEVLEELAQVRQHWQLAQQITQQHEALSQLQLWPFVQAETSETSVDWSQWLEQLALAHQLAQAQANYYQKLDATANYLPQCWEFQADELSELADCFEAQKFRLQKADGLLAQIQQSFPAAQAWLKRLVAKDEELKTPPSTAHAQPSQEKQESPEIKQLWTQSSRASWAEAQIQALQQSHPQLKQLSHALPYGSVEETSNQLLKLHEQLAQLESQRVAWHNDSRGLLGVKPAAYRARRSPEQARRESLLRECNKKRRVTPLRSLVREYSQDGILDILPVWLMSPETAVILFPRKPVFDLLIMDEASQCTVESGLPVLTRAKRSVIAGDDKQMPPSNFFQSNNQLIIAENEPELARETKPETEQDLDQDDDFDQDLDLDLDQQKQADASTEDIDVEADYFESESLLSLARQDIAHSHLRWHYRARFEELIAFSNHSMYNASLLTIPSTASRQSKAAIHWEEVEDGQWESGCNRREAQRVVDILAERLESQPQPPSLGVVTFNLKQRRTILDEIDRRCQEDEQFALRWSEAMNKASLDERPFVKNLESVQGDERDCIIFSLGYAPIQRKGKNRQGQWYVPARFGPLGRKRGERRLNVAVSRAKFEIVVVSSFEPSLLSVAKSKHEGPRMFKAFLEYAKLMSAGRRTQAQQILRRVQGQDSPKVQQSPTQQGSRSLWHLPFAQQVELSLQQRGLSVETKIGSSEFQLPVALIQAENPHQYALAILCDEPQSQEINAYEQFVHIPNVLKHRGWVRYLRITPYEWYHQQEQILQRIEALMSDD